MGVKKIDVKNKEFQLIKAISLFYLIDHSLKYIHKIWYVGIVIKSEQKELLQKEGQDYISMAKMLADLMFPPVRPLNVTPLLHNGMKFRFLSDLLLRNSDFSWEHFNCLLDSPLEGGVYR